MTFLGIGLVIAAAVCNFAGWFVGEVRQPWTSLTIILLNAAVVAWIFVSR